MLESVEKRLLEILNDTGDESSLRAAELLMQLDGMRAYKASL